jgi:hypothetical protein
MARVEAPVGIDRARHQDLSGRNYHVWLRRAVLAVVAAVPVLGLLNVFGQHATPVSYQSPSAALLINSPARVRGGLVFTTEIVITPRRQLHDARLYLDNSWFEAMTSTGSRRSHPPKLPRGAGKSGISGKSRPPPRSTCGSPGRPTPPTSADTPRP